MNQQMPQPGPSNARDPALPFKANLNMLIEEYQHCQEQLTDLLKLVPIFEEGSTEWTSIQDQIKIWTLTQTEKWLLISIQKNNLDNLREAFNAILEDEGIPVKEEEPTINIIGDICGICLENEWAPGSAGCPENCPTHVLHAACLKKIQGFWNNNDRRNQKILLQILKEKISKYELLLADQIYPFENRALVEIELEDLKNELDAITFFEDVPCPYCRKGSNCFVRAKTPERIQTPDVGTETNVKTFQEAWIQAAVDEDAMQIVPEQLIPNQVNAQILQIGNVHVLNDYVYIGTFENEEFEIPRDIYLELVELSRTPGELALNILRKHRLFRNLTDEQFIDVYIPKAKSNSRKVPQGNAIPPELRNIIVTHVKNHSPKRTRIEKVRKQLTKFYLFVKKF